MVVQCLNVDIDGSFGVLDYVYVVFGQDQFCVIGVKGVVYFVVGELVGVV